MREIPASRRRARSPTLPAAPLKQVMCHEAGLPRGNAAEAKEARSRRPPVRPARGTERAPHRPSEGSMLVGDVMTRGVETASTGATLQATALQMREAGVGMLPVLENERPIGVIRPRHSAA
ncbi:CBS domain-containing protein [Sorangium sp. So ce834]|uniref:CBS domain-containing protein n=1 Tax=Sorangium sp. So ce834 TaxID=3133321 RepID=UPI003F5EA000